MREIIILNCFMIFFCCKVFSQFDIKTYDKKKYNIESPNSTIIGGHIIFPVFVRVDFLNARAKAKSFIEKKDSVFYVQNAQFYPLEGIKSINTTKYSQPIENLKLTKRQIVDTLKFYSKEYNLFLDENKVKILFDKQNAVWIASRNSELYNISNNILKRYTKKDGLPSNVVNDIILNSKGQLIIATDKGICRKKNGSWTNVNLTTTNQKIKQIKNIYLLDEDDILFETYNGKVGLSDNGIFKYIDLPNDRVYHIFKDGYGNIWLHLGKDGILRIKKDKSSINYNIDLKKDELQNTFIDKYGNLWLIASNVIALLSENEIQMYFINNAAIHSIIEDDNKRIWFIGTNGSAYYEWSTNEFVDLNKEFDIPIERTLNMEYDPVYCTKFSNIDFLGNYKNDFLYTQYSVVEKTDRFAAVIHSETKEYVVVLIINNGEVFDITEKLKGLDKRPLNTYLDSEGNYWIDTPTQIHKLSIY